MTGDEPYLFGQKREDGTFYWGEHDHVVKRPPRTGGFDRPNSDPMQNDDVERWECLDCGLTTQADRGLCTVFSSRSCPPEVPHSSEHTPTCAPAVLEESLADMARSLAEEVDTPVREVAGRIQTLASCKVPPAEIERSLRESLADSGGGE